MCDSVFYCNKKADQDTGMKLIEQNNKKANKVKLTL